MAWFLVHQDAENHEKSKYPLQAGQKLFLARTSDGWSLTPTAKEPVLGSITMQSSGVVVLEAVLEPLEILPYHQHHLPSKGSPVKPSLEGYILQPSTQKRSEVMLLREKDTIKSSHVPNFHLVLARGNPTQVQVSSSVSQIPDSEEVRNENNDAGEATEDDEEDLDTTIKVAQSISRSTPLPSAARTEVVQETPTADRSLFGPHPAETFSTAPTKPEDDSMEDQETPDGREKTLSQAIDDVLQPHHRNPKTELPTKRTKPTPSHTDEWEVPSPPPKRAKTKSTPTPIPSTTKRKKRGPDPPSPPQETPPPTTTHSPSSTSPQHALENPRVAFSNSSITPTGQLAKFLKRHGGTIADSITPFCTVLCIKSGVLVRTPKLLHSIALGIPIVTDAWLVDSTTEGHFLPLEDYKPLCEKQEQDWGFDIEKIWGVPQDSLFAEYTIVFTPALKAKYKVFTEIENVCRAAGAAKVLVKVPGTKEESDPKGTIVLAVGTEDTKAFKGRMFDKEFLPRAILRGRVEVESEEFRIVREEDDDGDDGGGQEEDVEEGIVVATKKKIAGGGSAKKKKNGKGKKG
ncbi:unnamed protein product [Periconia digitata]|uniref:BRCT domain-containing protein n=1 Tax=Periconia digitata TaxID=1303443 RepID=A0A9W4UEA8_9PLEO|nr:unnamed protein product [Periconia digitata]